MKTHAYKNLLLILAGLLLPGAVTAFEPGAATSFEYDCMMEPHQVIEIKSAVDGRIEKINVERSDFVSEGQPLVVFESNVEKATVELARAKLEMEAELDSSKVSHRFAVRKFGRFDGLEEEGVVAAQTRDEVKTEAALAKLQILQAQENKHIAELELERALAVLNQHTVTSPLTGVVVDRFKSPGEYAEDSAILQLAQLDPLNIEVLLPVSMFGEIKPGMKARITPETSSGNSFSAEVMIVDRVLDASSGTFGVRLELPNPDNKLPGGLKCTVSFNGDNAEVAYQGARIAGTADIEIPER